MFGLAVTFPDLSYDCGSRCVPALVGQAGLWMRTLYALRPWPDAVDWSALLIFFGVVIVVPLLGFVLMYVDIRAYYRALKGVLVRVVYNVPALHAWARHETPGYMRALGVSLPCSEADLKRAYRALAEQHHPDRGGDPQKFHRLREQFEASMRFLKTHEPG